MSNIAPRPIEAMPKWSARADPDMVPVAEEVAVALTCDRVTCAVLMATPAALDDLAFGFCLTEGIISSTAEISGLEVLTHEHGIEVRLDLAPERQAHLLRRMRRMVGPMGCGLCGVQSLDEAMRRVPPVSSDVVVAPQELRQAMAELTRAQVMRQRTFSLHAAALWVVGEALVAVREDVGRHNALDKLVGATSRQDKAFSESAVILTSRISLDLVQKVATMGASVVVSPSAPTAAAVRLAESCGITIVANLRGDTFDVFTHPHRIVAQTRASCA